jgi:hypothetical protein
MTYQEIISQEINSLPEDILPEVLDFILFLKLKLQVQDESLSEKVKELRFQEELKMLTKSYRKRLSKEGKLKQSADEVMTELKKTREEIVANEYRK